MKAKIVICGVGVVHSLQMDWWELVISTLLFSLSISLFLYSSIFTLLTFSSFPSSPLFILTLLSHSIFPPALSIMHLLMGWLPLPAVALLTGPVNKHSRCARVCKRAGEACRPLGQLHHCFLIRFIPICPSVKTSVSLFLSVCVPPTIPAFQVA